MCADLTKHVVSDYQSIEELMNMGNSNRYMYSIYFNCFHVHEISSVEWAVWLKCIYVIILIMHDKIDEPQLRIPYLPIAVSIQAYIVDVWKQYHTLNRIHSATPRPHQQQHTHALYTPADLS